MWPATVCLSNTQSFSHTLIFKKTETEEHLKVFLSVLMDVINISKNPHLEGKPYAKKKVMRQLLQTEVQ